MVYLQEGPSASMSALLPDDQNIMSAKNQRLYLVMESSSPSSGASALSGLVSEGAGFCVLACRWTVMQSRETLVLTLLIKILPAGAG